MPHFAASSKESALGIGQTICRGRRAGTRYSTEVASACAVDSVVGEKAAGWSVYRLRQRQVAPSQKSAERRLWPRVGLRWRHGEYLDLDKAFVEPAQLLGLVSAQSRAAAEHLAPCNERLLAFRLDPAGTVSGKIFSGNNAAPAGF